MSFARGPIFSSFTSTPRSRDTGAREAGTGAPTSGRSRKDRHGTEGKLSTASTGLPKTSKNSTGALGDIPPNSSAHDCSHEMALELDKLHGIAAEQALRIHMLETASKDPAWKDKVATPRGVSTATQVSALTEIMSVLESCFPAVEKEASSSSPPPRKHGAEPEVNIQAKIENIKSYANQVKSLLRDHQRREQAVSKRVRVLERELAQSGEKKEVGAAPHSGVNAGPLAELEKKELDGLKKQHKAILKELETASKELQEKKKENQALLQELRRAADLVHVLKQSKETVASKKSAAEPSRLPSVSSHSSPPSSRRYHCRFSGAAYVAAYHSSPQAFEEALLDDVCELLSFSSFSAVLDMAVRPGPRSVTVEIVLPSPLGPTSSSSSTSAGPNPAASLEEEEEVQRKLWDGDFRHLDTLVRSDATATTAGAMAEMGSIRPKSTAARPALAPIVPSSALTVLTQQLKDTRALLSLKEGELEAYHKRHAQLKEAHESDRVASHQDAQAVLREAEKTIETLQGHLEQIDEEREMLATERTQLQQALEAEKQAHASLRESLQKKMKVLEGQLHDAAAAPRTGFYTEVFDILIPLSSLKTAKRLATMLEEDSHASVVHDLLLQHVALRTQTVPVGIRRCVVVGESSAVKCSRREAQQEDPSPGVRVSVELGFYATSAERNHATAGVRSLVEERTGSQLVSTVEDYLELSAAAASRADSAVRSNRLSITSQQEVVLLVESVLSVVERLSTPDIGHQLALVMQKYRSRDESAQKYRLENVQLQTRLQLKEKELERYKEARTRQHVPVPAPPAEEAEKVKALEAEVYRLSEALEVAKQKEASKQALLVEQNQVVELLHKQLTRSKGSPAPDQLLTPPAPLVDELLHAVGSVQHLLTSLTGTASPSSLTIEKHLDVNEQLSNATAVLQSIAGQLDALGKEKMASQSPPPRPAATNAAAAAASPLPASVESSEASAPLVARHGRAVPGSRYAAWAASRKKITSSIPGSKTASDDAPSSSSGARTA